MRIDLHLHSLYSDGKKSPKEVVAILARRHIQLAALSDHDTVAGIEEFQRSARVAGIVPVPGVEISVFYEGIGLHILGLGIDPRDAGLIRLFARQREERRISFGKTMERFRRAGFFIDRVKFEKIKRLPTVAKPHVFELLWGSLQNRKLLADRFDFQDSGRSTMGKFIQRFTSVPGQIGYVRKNRVTMREAILLIHRAGGLAVWAHPGVEREIPKKQLPRVLKHFTRMGLDGIEVFSPAHTKGEMAWLAKLALSYGFLASAGSDDHNGLRIGKLRLPKFAKNSLAKLETILKKRFIARQNLVQQ